MIESVGGEKLHVEIDGSGPVVLFSAGLGESWFDWEPVVPLLRHEYRLVRFDRPGLGESPIGRRAPTLRVEAARFATLADRYSPDTPAYVVAHSAAALHAEAFARRHPTRLAGLVLVDPSFEPSVRPRSGHLDGVVRQVIEKLPALAGPLSATRLVRLVGPPAYRAGYRYSNERGVAPDGPVDRVYGSADTAVAALAEYAAYRDQAVDLRRLRARLPFPSVPVVVLTALAGRSARSAARWSAETARLARLLSGAQTTLPDARHLVMIDRPDAIADAVRAVTR